MLPQSLPPRNSDLGKYTELLIHAATVVSKGGGEEGKKDPNPQKCTLYLLPHKGFKVLRFDISKNEASLLVLNFFK